MLPTLANSLGSLLKARGMSRSFISVQLLTDILNLAYERARAVAPDRCARYGVLWQQMEKIANAAAQIHKGAKELDPAIEIILRKHHA